MYTNKIGTATLAGHGLGNHLAIATSAYEPSKFTGIVGIDSSPLDYRGFESLREIKKNLNILQGINPTWSETQIKEFL